MNAIDSAYEPLRLVDTPERALCRAVLRRAIEDFLHSFPLWAESGDNPRALRLSAKKWLTSQAKTPFSCRFCCDVLGITQMALLTAIKMDRDGVLERVSRLNVGVRD